jgi:hypothetical protein
VIEHCRVEEHLGQHDLRQVGLFDAAVKPDLGAVSLKPYLFVIKERKNYLGSAAPLP